MGETAQIQSGGALLATPHAVRGIAPSATAAAGVSREAFAVFMQPMWDEPMHAPAGVSAAAAVQQGKDFVLPPGVPDLAARWEPGFSFGDFAARTAAAYTAAATT
jgi:hypothetical protein